MSGPVLRRPRREEIGLLWTIERAEIVERIYDLRDGVLMLGRTSSTSAAGRLANP